jgi:CheY-like chemotaxis protein
MRPLDLTTREHCRSAGVDAADVLAALIDVLASARGATMIGSAQVSSARAGGMPTEAEVAGGSPTLLALVRHAAAERFTRHESKPDVVLCDILRERADGCETVVDLDLDNCNE